MPYYGCWLNDRVRIRVCSSSQVWIDELKTASIVQEIKFKILLPNNHCKFFQIFVYHKLIKPQILFVILKLILVNPTNPTSPTVELLKLHSDSLPVWHEVTFSNIPHSCVGANHDQRWGNNGFTHFHYAKDLVANRKKCYLTRETFTDIMKISIIKVNPVVRTYKSSKLCCWKIRCDLGNK